MKAMRQTMGQSATLGLGHPCGSAGPRGASPVHAKQQALSALPQDHVTSAGKMAAPDDARLVPWGL